MRVVKSADERKNEILDVAEQLFSEKGFDNASTNDIINRIGIARGTLYHHFASKEEILDALVERMTREGIARAGMIVMNTDVPILERLTGAIMALRIDNGASAEVMEQIHKPQNALLHQKMQDRLLGGVVPFIAQLIEEGNASGLFDTKFPVETAEMIMIYSSYVFDERTGLDPEEKDRKAKGFINLTEKLLGAKENSLAAAIMKLIQR